MTGVQFCFVFPALLKPETDIIALLPPSDNSFADESIKQISAEASKDVLFLISAKNSLKAIEMGQVFEAEVKNSTIFASVAPLQAEELLKSGLELYAPYGHYILPEKTKNLLIAKGLPAGLQQSLAILQSPLSVFYADFIIKDPLFNVPLFLQESAPQNQNQTIQSGYMLLKNESLYYFVINARLKTSAFEKGTHDILMPTIEKAELALKNKYPEFQLVKSGLVFFAQRASVMAQKEISWLGSLSMLGVLLIMLIVFRSFKQVLLSLLSIGVGILTALTVTLMIFPKIHLVTLTFGTSLIGVSIDYSTHYFTDYLMNRNNWSPRDCLKRIGSGVTWGAFTTILAFIAIAINPLPGLHQIAVFSVAGIFAAYFTVMVAFPILLSETGYQRKPFAFINRIFGLLFIFPSYVSKLKPLFFLLTPLMVLALFFVKTDDDLRSLQTPPPDLMQNEKLVHQMLHKYEPARFILVRSETVEMLLQKEESLRPLLSDLVKNNHIAHYLAITRFLPSQSEQEKNYHLLKKSILNTDVIFNEDEKNILDSSDFKIAYHTDSETKKLTPETFYASTFGEKFRNLLHQDKGMPFSLILLQSVSSDNIIIEALKSQTDVFYINKTAQISQTLKKMREQILYSTIIVYLLIYILLCFKHGIKTSLAIIAIPAFAAGLSILIVAITGNHIHISHTLAIIIVLGTGIDYTIFLSEIKTQQGVKGSEMNHSSNLTENQSRNEATTLAISLSAITTILSFGLLAFCQTEFLSAFGMIILLGVSFSYLLAPLFFAETKKIK